LKNKQEVGGGDEWIQGEPRCRLEKEKEVRVKAK